MSLTKAVIDIGTNTFHLLIAKVEKNQDISIVYRNTIPVKLGEGGVDKGFIAEAAYQRGIEALALFKSKLDEFTVQSVKAVATAAVRGASNGSQFIADVYRLTKIEVELIDGMREAAYIYEGAKGAGLLNEETSLIMDIGGGSTEFILCNARQIFWKDSYPLGASRLLAHYYQHENAIEPETVKSMVQYFREQLSDFFDAVKQFPPQILIGTAGSFDSYANILALRNNQLFNPLEMKSFILNATDFQELLGEIISSTHAERVRMEGLIPLRVDMIVMASILTQFILDVSRLHKVLTCTYSLKEGLLLSSD